jgi:hypothetical protein
VDFLHPAGTALAVRASNHNAPIDKFAPIPNLEIVYNPEVLYLQLQMRMIRRKLVPGTTRSQSMMTVSEVLNNAGGFPA